MVAARIPAIIIPATIGIKKLPDNSMNIFSDELAVRNASGYKILPIIPMDTAASNDIAHQTDAILLDNLS